MKKLYYFAFGSNMLLSRLEDRVHEVKKVGTYVLYGYKLVFNCGYWYNAFANIEKGSKTDFVEGVLYELTPEQIWRLDHYEAVPENYYKEYFIHPDGNVVFAYVATDELKIRKGKKAKPELKYLNILLDGCVENGFKHTFEQLYSYKQKHYLLMGNRHFEKFEDNF